MLFVEPIWLSILIPTAFALVLLTASLAIRDLHGSLIDKSPVLSAAGLILAWISGGALFAIVLAGFVLFTHGSALAIERARNRRAPEASARWPRARAWLMGAVAAQIAMVVAISRWGIAGGALQNVSRTLVPFGVSYFAFHGISYLLDVYHRRASAERSRSHLAIHLVLLPQIVGGPVAYEGMTRQLARRLPSISDYSFGVRRLLIGVWKVFVMARFASAQADAVFAATRAGLTPIQAWAGLASFALQIYYAFSGYSDMGIGLGRMVGIRLPENFRWPYVAETVREFWRRWHIGLTTWFRDYAEMSLAEDHVPPPSVAREALVVLLCSVWYGFGWPFIAWGVYHAALIAMEGVGGEAAVKRLPAPLRHAYVIAAVMIGWILLRSATPGDALLLLRALAGVSPAAGHARLVIAPEFWLLLIAGAIGCAPLFPSIRRWTVAIDGLMVSLLMMLFASVLFAWRGVRPIAVPVVRLWRGSPVGARRSGGRAL